VQLSSSTPVGNATLVVANVPTCNLQFPIGGKLRVEIALTLHILLGYGGDVWCG
jgi:hypothetical protein